MYSRERNDKEFTFGVSGLLYRANVLMYDHQSESLWSQVKREAVTGPLTGTPLRVLPSTVTTWRKWKKRYPKTEVLSLETGHVRDYSRDPYEEYYRRERGIFSFLRPGLGVGEKELVVGVTVGDAARGYSVAEVRERGVLSDDLGGERLTLSHDLATDALSVVNDGGDDIPHVVVYWFVWKGIHPQSGRYPSRP